MRGHWAGGTDQYLAGRRFTCLFGDLEMPAPSEVAAALSEIAAAGTHTRLALSPEPGRRMWNRDLGTPIPVCRLPDDVAAGDPTDVLQHVRRSPGLRSPLTAHVSARHLVLDIDHGLGDGRFAVDLTSALFAHCKHGSTPWVSSRPTRLALPRALFHMFAGDPGRLRTVWRQATEFRSPPAHVPVSTEPWTPSHAVVLARIGADQERAVNQWCRAQGEKPGSAAVWLHLVRRALAAAEVPMTSRVIVAFDCRRYQPQGHAANGNFMIGLDLPCDVDAPVAVLAARLREVVAAGTPLAGMAAISARALLGYRPDRSVPGVRPGAAAGEVMYTDMGLLTRLDVPWRAGGSRIATGLLDPAGPCGITVLSARADDTRTIAISFHDNVFERKAIERAASVLGDPMRIVTG
ncbi:hypothetical protein [Mycolicibacterium cosmeticum]|uniref:hypothetical protein n=1 Tax=Mycolicibacterium cosmeticum TaxID=258533 RepID=UPI0032047149